MATTSLRTLTTALCMGGALGLLLPGGVRAARRLLSSSAAPAGYDAGNIFAKIIAGDIPSFKVMETEHCIAILDAFPVCPGHTLLIPKKASVTCADMEGDSLTGTMAELPKLVRAVQKATGAPAARVISNVGPEAGQIVFHTHFHIIPRHTKDASWANSKDMVTKEEAVPVMEAIKKALAEGC
eukprot:CAMPEP_0182534514 /NCGR_PEP_ID=MMETSP1323-20130603/15902_1 /TAXON_ID=236787 /ORGANISM="Florenciella parvula, Strain RCC1693" /LENGTH=182 /DNA_ID=CAMNT_0024744537 /DNA_START=14 /DNA_END=562 /DNA_ORIENTATION=+